MLWTSAAMSRPSAASPRLVGRARDGARGERQVADGVAHHRVAGLEPLDALFLRIDGGKIRLDVGGEPVGERGDAPRGRRRAHLSAAPSAG